MTLIALLELCDDDLLRYVIDMPTNDVPELSDRITRARDLARSVRVKRAAMEALG